MNIIEREVMISRIRRGFYGCESCGAVVILESTDAIRAVNPWEAEADLLLCECPGCYEASDTQGIPHLQILHRYSNWSARKWKVWLAVKGVWPW